VRVVLDASAAVRIALAPKQAQALSETVEEADQVLAPDLLVAEVTNSFWKYLRAGSLARADAEAGIRAALGLIDEVERLEPLAVEAFDLAASTRCPVYDMFYLVLARRHGALLATADAQLLRLARDLGIRATAPTTA